jgi:hypothetical protein
MKFYDITFFCGKDDGGVKALVQYEPEDQNWPFTLRLNKTGEVVDNPEVKFFLSESNIINLKVSLNQSYELVLRRRKELQRERANRDNA